MLHLMKFICFMKKNSTYEKHINLPAFPTIASRQTGARHSLDINRSTSALVSARGILELGRGGLVGFPHEIHELRLLATARHLVPVIFGHFYLTVSERLQQPDARVVVDFRRVSAMSRHLLMVKLAGIVVVVNE